MTDTIKPIPTMYKGRQYRSRLEARWAAFFDLLNWPVEYEPCDFNGWIPDFVIAGDKTVYVEVKPVSKFPEDVAAELEASGCETEMLIAGQGLVTNADRALCLGWLTERYGRGEFCWASAPLGIWETNNPKRTVGFCHEYQSFADRVTGSYDGGSNGFPSKADENRVAQLWAEAGNIVQWKAPR